MLQPESHSSGQARLQHLAAGMALLISGVSAQSAISPSGAATVEGTTRSTIPFLGSLSSRYLQLHGDLPTSLTIHRLSFRQDAGSVTNFTGTRSIDLELFLGNTSQSFDTPSMEFLGNYSGSRTARIARKTVNFGPQGQNAVAGPRPFQGMDLPLDSPFFHPAGFTLVWESLIRSGTTTGTMNSLDADDASGSVSGPLSTGIGCIATGRTAAMTHDARIGAAFDRLSFGVTVKDGPSNASTVLALGTVNSDILLPGLCSRLFTNLLVTVPIGSTNASGAITPDMAVGFYAQNTSPGAKLFTQVHSLDPARADLFKICNSGGAATTYPARDLTKQVKVTALTNLSAGIGATRAEFNVSDVGRGLVVRFD